MPDDFDYSQPRRSTIIRTDYPIITMLLIVLSVAFTAAFWFSNYNPASPMKGIADIGVVGVDKIWSGHYAALVMCMFPHVNVLHIVFNMMWTWRLGSAIEAEIKPLVYVLFIVTACVIGAAVDICVQGTTGIGMSGVVYAMFGLMWAGRGSYASWRGLATRDNLNLFIVWGVLCIVTTVMKVMAIGNGAHFGGLVFGLCVGFLWFAPRRRPIFAAPLALLGFASILSITWAPWSGSWQWWKGNVEYDAHRYQSAISHYYLALRLGGDRALVTAGLILAWSGAAQDAMARGDKTQAERSINELDRLSKQLSSMSTADKSQVNPAVLKDLESPLTDSQAPGSGGTDGLDKEP